MSLTSMKHIGIKDKNNEECFLAMNICWYIVIYLNPDNVLFTDPTKHVKHKIFTLKIYLFKVTIETLKHKCEI